MCVSVKESGEEREKEGERERNREKRQRVIEPMTCLSIFAKLHHERVSA